MPGGGAGTNWPSVVRATFDRPNVTHDAAAMAAAALRDRVSSPPLFVWILGRICGFVGGIGCGDR